MEKHSREPRYRRNLFINSVTLMGMVPFAPEPRIAKNTGSLWTTFDLSVHSVQFDGSYKPGESVTILCKAWGETARKMVDRCPAKTFVLVRGSLAPDEYTNKNIRALELAAGKSRNKSRRGVVVLHVELARIVRKSVETQKTIRINRDEYRRLKALEKHHDPDGTWLDPEVMARYNLGDDEFDSLTEGTD